MEYRNDSLKDRSKITCIFYQNKNSIFYKRKDSNFQIDIIYEQTPIEGGIEIDFAIFMAAKHNKVTIVQYFYRKHAMSHVILIVFIFLCCIIISINIISVSCTSRSRQKNIVNFIFIA